ncbi:hypothetical protein J6590_041017 [Homalodisca vitripennis]|nr:hypothetical protein J6590_041017 [Homalodisca vitripennis]
MQLEALCGLPSLHHYMKEEAALGAVRMHQGTKEVKLLDWRIRIINNWALTYEGCSKSIGTFYPPAETNEGLAAKFSGDVEGTVMRAHALSSTSRNENVIEQVRNLVTEDRCLTVRELA